MDAAESAKGYTILERAQYGTTWTGANLVWMVKCQIMHGALSGNATMVGEGFTRLWKEIYYAHLTDDNIQVHHSNACFRHCTDYCCYFTRAHVPCERIASGKHVRCT